MTLTQIANENPENQAAAITFLAMFNNVQKMYFDHEDSRKVPKIFYLLYQQANKLRDRYLDDENTMMVYSGGVSQLAKKTSANDPDFSLKLIRELVSISIHHEHSREIATFALKAVGYYCRYNHGMTFLKLLPFVLKVCCNPTNQTDEFRKLIRSIFEVNGKAVARLANPEKQSDNIADICPFIDGEGFIYYLQGEELWARMDLPAFNNPQFLQANFSENHAFVQYLLKFFDALESGNIIFAEKVMSCMEKSLSRDTDRPFLIYSYGVALFSLSNAQHLPEAAEAIDRLRKEAVQFPQIPDLLCLLGFSLTNQAKKLAALLPPSSC